MATMEKTILATNFMHTEEDHLEEKFELATEQWSDDSVTTVQVLAAFKAAQSKVCRPDFPPEETSGYRMGDHMIRALKDLASMLISDEKAKPADFQEIYLGFILALIEAGPLSSHIEFIKQLQEDSDIEFEDYFHSIRGDRLKKIVHSLKKDYRLDAKMEDDPRLLKNFLSDFIDGFSEKQCEEMRAEFIDLIIYFKSAFGHRGEEMRKAMYDSAYSIERKFDREIFRGVSDVKVLTQTIEKLRHVMTTPEFPQTPDVGKEVKDVLSDLLKAVSEDGQILNTYDAIMDLALDLTIKKAGCEGTRVHFQTIGYFFYHIKDTGVQDNAELFEGLGQKYAYFLNNVKDEVYLTYKFVEPVMYDCLNKAMGKSDKHVRQWIDMIKVLLTRSVPACISTALRAMREKDDLLKWKKLPDDIREIFALLTQISFPKWLTAEQLKRGMEEMKNLTDYFLDEAKKAGIAKLNLTQPMVPLIFHYIEMGTEETYELAAAVADHLEYMAKRDKELMMDSIYQVTTVLEDDSIDWGDSAVTSLSSCLLDIVNHVFDSVKDGKVFTWDEYDDFIYLCKLCERKMHSAEEPQYSAFFNIYTIISMKITAWLQTMNEIHRLIPMVPSVMNLLECEEEIIQSVATSLLTLISRSSGAMFARYMEKMVAMFLENEQDQVLDIVCSSYEFNPGPVEKRFEELFEHMDSGNSTVRIYILQLLGKVAKHQPHLLTEERVKMMVQEAKEDSTQQAQIFMMLDDVAKHHIDKFEPVMKDLLTPDLWMPMSAYHRTVILQLYALESEEKAEKITQYLLTRIQASDDHTEVLVSLNAFRLIGFKHRSAVEKHRSAIEQFMEKTGDNDYHTSCTYLLDMLDGKSLDKVAQELKELQGDVAELEVRVTATENDIADVKDTVQRQGDDLENVKGDVKEQGQRLDDVKGTVDDTIAKVQEIDGKTLSHAPSWAGDVAKLLNPEADADWRLLSLRLGFTNDDIRAWAQHANPCMVMLNEWYATHKTREATHAVLTSLQLLDREDAAVIVENAMKNAEDVVENEDFEYATPPDIFLSYQWGHQNEVKLLRQHLEMAGFSCWMDVGQMGGGDKLFEKIDSGVRGAQVVISCVSAKYAKSPNCNREVNLSVNLGKPIIPLLMEKTTWPPPGSMGPIFSEYLFIRFFQRGGEETSDQRYWPLAKFQELLMQLALLGVKPDQQVVQPEYKDWWVPKVEEVTVDKDRAKKQQSTINSSSTGTDDSMATSPDVFISYQWGKQPQIIKLYQTLTSLGYSCWLDIMQMGGGDSLYDKIDRGLRGCRVVLSCITTKYAKSANCRREVSLADALQKPLIPLLLESLSWPPPGPMSPILTQLLYINCTRDNMEETWTGPKFEELLAMINQHVPHNQPAAQQGEVSTSVEQQRTAQPEEQVQVTADPCPAVPEEEVKSEPVPKETSKPPPLATRQPSEDGSRQQSGDPEPSPTQDDADRKERNGGEDRRQEHHPDTKPQSPVSSVLSDLGHDAHDEGRQKYVAMMAAQPKSACCVIL